MNSEHTTVRGASQSWVVNIGSSSFSLDHHINKENLVRHPGETVFLGTPHSKPYIHY